MLIPQGLYPADPVRGSARLEERGQNGSACVTVEFDVLGIPGVDGPVRRTRSLFLTDTTFERSVESLNYCGWGGDFNDLSGVGAKRVQVEIGHRDYEGKTYDEIKWVNQEGGRVVAGTPIGQAGADQMNARLAALKQRRAAKQGAPALAATGTDGPMGPPDDDDRLPF